MIELKVQCDCGQKFKFDVEPVNGRMGYRVNCPVCGRDGTEKGNDILRERYPNFAESAPPPPPPPARMQPAGLRINAGSHAPSGPTEGAPPPLAAPRFMPGRSQHMSVSTVEPMDSKKFTLGVVGAIAGGLIGMFAWFAIFKATGFSLGFLAFGVAALTGYGAKLLGRCPSNSMGIVTATVALICIFGAQFMKANSLWHEDESSLNKEYEEELAEARKTIAIAPNGTDEEIKKYLLKQAAADGEKPDAGQITPEEIKFFRELSWQRMKDIESGKISKDSFIQEKRKLEGQISDTWIAKILFWVMALGIFNIIYIIASVGLAYKIGIGEK